jgi:hypothetical protein
MFFLRKKRFKYACLTSLIFLILPIEIVAASVEEPPSAVEICKNQPQCEFSGTNKAWPSDGFDLPTFIYSNKMFDITLPRAIDRVSVGWGNSPLYAIWLGTKKIAFGVEEVPAESTSTDYPAILKQKKHSDWIPTDIFKIIFNNHKPSDKEPENAYERYLWRTAFFRKVIVYKSLAYAHIYNNGPWTAYTALVDIQSKNRLTVVTHEKFPSRYLTIRDNGVELEFIEKILAEIKLR